MRSILAVELYEEIKEPLQLQNTNVHYWTDSTIVLAWLRRPPKQWKVFVSNRTAKILELSHAHQWKHVRTHLNPADCASRGIGALQLREHDLWWHGPPFLTKSSTHWPKENFTISPCEKKITD